MINTHRGQHGFGSKLISSIYTKSFVPEFDCLFKKEFRSYIYNYTPSKRNWTNFRHTIGRKPVSIGFSLFNAITMDTRQAFKQPFNFCYYIKSQINVWTIRNKEGSGVDV